MYQRKLIAFLSGPAASLLAITVAIAARIFMQIHFLNTDNDKSYQLQAAQNFINGNGFTLLETTAADLSRSAFAYLNRWPPGYSFFVSPFLLITNNVIIASLMLDAVTCFLFVFFSRKILKRVNLPVPFINIYTLFSGLFLYSFCITSSSDFLALTLLIVAVITAISMSKATTFVSFNVVLLSVLLFFTAATRYMYIPVAFALPACLILYGFINKNKALKKSGIVSFAITAILIISLLLYQYSNSGAATHIRDTGSGFYPEVLAEIRPFLFSSFFNVEFATFQFSQITGLSFTSISVALGILHWLLLLTIIFISLLWILQQKKIKDDPINLYILCGAVISFIIIFLLTWLSLTNSPVVDGSNTKWTYLHEDRYFAFPIFFFQQVFFLVLNRCWQIRNRVFKTLIVFAFGILMIDFVHNVYYTTKAVWVSKKSLYKNPKSSGLLTYVESLCTETYKKYPGKKVVFYSWPIFIGAQAAIQHPAPALYNWTNKQLQHLQTTEEVLLINVKNKDGLLPEIFTRYQVLEKKEYDKYEFITLKILPDSTK